MQSGLNHVCAGMLVKSYRSSSVMTQGRFARDILPFSTVAMNQLVGEVDLIYLPQHHSVVSALDSVASISRISQDSVMLVAAVHGSLTSRKSLLPLPLAARKPRPVFRHSSQALTL